MPLSGTGMLITLMDVLPAEEADFHLWYDREHLPERVGIEGFLEARRYEAVDGTPKYLNFYTTTDFDVLESQPYKAALARQTSWSLHHISRFLNPLRVCGRVLASHGEGRGAAVCFIRLRPAPEARGVLAEFAERWAELLTPGVLSVHLVEGDAELSKPLVPVVEIVGSDDAYLILDATSTEIAAAAGRKAASLSDTLDGLGIVSSGVWKHLSDLTKSELRSGLQPPTADRAPR